MCFRSGRQDRTGLIAAAFAADVKLKVALLLSNRSATGRDCSRVRGRPPKKIGPNLGKPPPERSGDLHNAPTVTLPACYFASTARRYLPSSAYFAYALLKSKAVTPIECLHYALNLPTSVVITGIDSMELLDQAFEAVRTFHSMSDAE